ncbi:hypothetical protein [Deinococcus arcticus]|uniref:Uncharacterized protein n=1 Tax=Deinococcus arcticus TaxID=2136176 RepID=A0A2T3W5M7_9DEIO|nr:hypothetical protein [Deinococcus arcticus]PTA67179.1 hypothetical protein C8263_13870 [Deinococcus arcticus]
MIRGTFEATLAFAPDRPLFDEDARCAEQVADDDLPEALALRGPRGVGQRDMLLSIEGDWAGFRPLHPEEEPL